MSDIVYVEDRAGEKMKFRRDGEIILPSSCPGTHWSFEMVSMMTNKKAETTTKNKNNHMLEFEPISSLDELPSPRILNTHLKLKLLPGDMKSKPIRLIYLLRNPRDACASYYKWYIGHSSFGYKGQFSDWLPVQLEGALDWGNWFDHVRSWERDIESHPNLKVHYLQYEKVLKDPLEELKKVGDFLGYDGDDSLLHEIVEKCHIDRMREDKLKYEDDKGHLHYNKGKAGSWKSMFTVEQYELFEKMYREKMAGSKFEQLYKGPVDIL